MTNPRDSYLGNKNLKASDVPVNFTKEQVEEYLKCANDPEYFIRTYIRIVNVDEGLIPFDLYDFQSDIINKIHNNRFVIAKLPRQSGKSTTVIAYLLHYVLFNESVNVAVLANKLATARELLGRLNKCGVISPRFDVKSNVRDFKIIVIFIRVMKNGLQISYHQDNLDSLF